MSRTHQWRSEGGQGGHGPRAPWPPGAISLGLSFFVLKTFFFFFFLLVNFFPRGGCRISQTGGGADPSIGPWALETLATPLVHALVTFPELDLFYLYPQPSSFRLSRLSSGVPRGGGRGGGRAGMAPGRKPWRGRPPSL